MQIVYQTGNSNTPAVVSAATALAVNKKRNGWSIQNHGTNPLFVLLGDGATTSVFHRILRASTGQDDGSGGIWSQDSGVVYTGIITIAGTSPRYTVLEM